MSDIVPTQITPPRVPIIDQRTGLVDRTWYRWFLSMFTGLQGVVGISETVPSESAAAAIYEQLIEAVAQAAQTQPPNAATQFFDSYTLAPPLVAYAPPNDVGLVREASYLTAGTALSGGGSLGGNVSLKLADTAVTPAVYGDSSHVSQITVDQQGRLTLAASVAISASAIGAVTTTGSPASGNLAKFSAAGTITSGDLSGDVTTSGTLATTLANTAVAAASYGDSSHVAAFTVDAKGRLTLASNVAITIAAVSGGTPAADGTYASPTSITIHNGVITAIS